MASVGARQSEREEQLRWLEAILTDNGWTSTQLANAAGFHPSRIVGFRRDRSGAAVLDEVTVARIEAVAGRCRETDRAATSMPRHSAEADLVSVSSMPPWFETDHFQAWTTMEHAKPYLVVTNVLFAAGYRAGGVALVDASLQPKSNDVVVVTIAGGPPMLRMYTRPMLYTCPFPPDRTEVSLLDDETTVVGVVIAYAFGRMSLVPKVIGATAFPSALEALSPS